MNKRYLCPFTTSEVSGDKDIKRGGRICPAKEKEADWLCPLAFNGECAFWVIAYNINTKEG